MKIFLHNCFSDIVSIDNLLEAWKEFEKGKKKKPDVQEFSLKLMDNILSLHRDLSQGSYRHGGYKSFIIHDPKQRQIHKACVRDRLLHHAVYRKLYPFFNRTFTSDSFSSRKGKGAHRAIVQCRRFASKVSENNMKTCWVLQCDIRKFFASIDHEVLLSILGAYIKDEQTMVLLEKIIRSHSSATSGIGLPLGNLTSQLFVNVYLNELDQFVKHRLKARYYIRYADDFLIMSQNKEWLESICVEIGSFLREKLKLELNLSKTSIKTLASGIDFLGYVIFPHHIVLRTKTRKRMMARVNENNLPSYLGILGHCNGYGLEIRIKNLIES